MPRVSQEKKVEIRRDMILAAVELFADKGLGGATMRQISKNAGYSPTTIYNYFPNKGRIFYAYFDLKQDELAETLAAIEDLDEYTLREKLQIQLESLLDVYLPDREFVRAAYKTLLDSPLKSFGELAPIKQKYTDVVRRCFAAAKQAGELEEQPYERLLVDTYWDFTNLIILYWLRDDSEGFCNTTTVIDLAVDIYVDLVRSGLVTKVADMLSFLIKSHLYGHLGRLTSLLALLGEGEGEGGEEDNRG